MRKFLSLLLTTCYLLSTTSVLAVCPVCTVVIGTGLGLSRYLGIDDTISGVWVGALVLSVSFWLVDWLSKRGIKLKSLYSTLVVVILMFIIALVPLQISGLVGHPNNTIFGVDKLLFGTAVGCLVFLSAVRLDKIVRILRGRQLFIYQKIILPVLALIVTSLILYTLIK